jgi:uncharacterized cupredoxin-like copper-binding protein
MARSRLGVIWLLAVGSVLAASLPALAHRSAATGGTITVTAGKPTEFKFRLSKQSVSKGAVTFVFSNKGRLAHDFKIAGKVTKHVSSGRSAVLRVVFPTAGRYPYLCTVSGHAAAGMKGILRVT